MGTLIKNELLQKAAKGFNIDDFDLNAIYFDEELEIVALQIECGDNWIDYHVRVWVNGDLEVTDVEVANLYIWGADGEELNDFTTYELEQAILKSI